MQIYQKYDIEKCRLLYYSKPGNEKKKRKLTIFDLNIAAKPLNLCSWLGIRHNTC